MTVDLGYKAGHNLTHRIFRDTTHPTMHVCDLRTAHNRLLSRGLMENQESYTLHRYFYTDTSNVLYAAFTKAQLSEG